MRHSAFLAPLALIASLAGCVTAEPGWNGNTGPIPPHIPHSPVPGQARAASGDPIIIRDNRGGNVMEAMVHRAELQASGRPVEVRGYCGSSCTILITLPNACLAPDATVGFHAPSFEGTTMISPVGPMIASYYRGGIRQKFNDEWGRSRKITRITAREYVALDPQTRLCAK